MQQYIIINCTKQNQSFIQQSRYLINIKIRFSENQHNLKFLISVQLQPQISFRKYQKLLNIFLIEYHQIQYLDQSIEHIQIQTYCNTQDNKYVTMYGQESIFKNFYMLLLKIFLGDEKESKNYQFKIIYRHTHNDNDNDSQSLLDNITLLKKKIISVMLYLTQLTTFMGQDKSLFFLLKVILKIGNKQVIYLKNLNQLVSQIIQYLLYKYLNYYLQGFEQFIRIKRISVQFNHHQRRGSKFSKKNQDWLFFHKQSKDNLIFNIKNDIIDYQLFQAKSLN
ncbi:unnamed protein product [Paramecium sonneborni]|uniref:Uncharacterized protein n=1 Tax=Paramecium sonneborni TaxID=65129 RepID=A0A8S1QFU4_9CILI|nr:unnamed protein product [Paramecium sonneborni]